MKKRNQSWTINIRTVSKRKTTSGSVAKRVQHTHTHTHTHTSCMNNYAKIVSKDFHYWPIQSSFLLLLLLLFKMAAVRSTAKMASSSSLRPLANRIAFFIGSKLINTNDTTCVWRRLLIRLLLTTGPFSLVDAQKKKPENRNRPTSPQRAGGRCCREQQQQQQQQPKKKNGSEKPSFNLASASRSVIDRASFVLTAAMRFTLCATVDCFSFFSFFFC